MLGRVLGRVYRLARAASCAARCRALRWLRPAATDSSVLGAAADLLRGKPELVAENALLRQQLIILARSSGRPRITGVDRAVLVLLASRVRDWRRLLVIVQPATLLRWHRAGFRLFWRWRSRARSRQPRVAPDVVDLIERMAREKRLWGAASASGASCSSSASASASAPSSGTCGASGHRVPPVNPGPRSCALTAARSGHATFSR